LIGLLNLPRADGCQLYQIASRSVSARVIAAKNSLSENKSNIRVKMSSSESRVTGTAESNVAVRKIRISVVLIVAPFLGILSPMGL
jgi:hypothetical protein